MSCDDPGAVPDLALVALEGALSAPPRPATDILLPRPLPVALCGQVQYSDEEWKTRLSPEAYLVLRREATERRWTRWGCAWQGTCAWAGGCC